MNNLTYSEAGFALTKSFEGLRLTAYKDSGGVPTIGYGHILGVSPGDSCSEAQADQWLSEDVQVAEHAVNTLVTAPLNQNQFDALVDFCFNLGAGSLKSSTLLSLLNQGAVDGASQQFTRWVYVNGVPNPGLERRRLAEQKLFNQEAA